MNDLLKGKKGIISGALNPSSIAWQVAEKAHEQGAKILLTNAPIALSMGQTQELADKLGSRVVAADATNIKDIQNLYATAKEEFEGQANFLLHSIGMSPNIRKGREYHDLHYPWFENTLNVSAISFHKMMQVAMKEDLMAEGSSIIALSYIAAQRAFEGYCDMSDAKALLESIARNFGYAYGLHNKTRVNTISQSPTRTTAGKGITGFNSMFNFSELFAPLGNATAEECADYCVALFSDLTRMVTMQNLNHDGGYAAVGMTKKAIEKLVPGDEK